jgi:hypothetical protein
VIHSKIEIKEDELFKRRLIRYKGLVQSDVIRLDKEVVDVILESKVDD